ncbi:LysR family transcriptional regulator [Herbaspirillum rhizosphaerae]|uniref:LysR family transcriptional regulator n=1 Tax=Herbaspirillum rhizosphaerae TaxID=346179 RepID=UPI00067C7963|nr:LysR family transcriptional regulator [Herbaspirillum rhizosphaerae]
MDQLLALRVFVRIAEAGTFTKASDSLDIPKPTVTKLIQELESHLGTKLLQRTTRRVTVTPEGAAYYQRALRLIGELEDMDAAAGRARAQPKGRLRIDIGSSLASLILIPALPDFRKRYPDIQLDLGVSDRAVDMVGDAVDCVIRGGALQDSTLVARRIAELDYVTCATPAYLKARGKPKHPSELEQSHDIVGYFSSLTGRPFPLLFARDGATLEMHAATAVAVNESTAHMTALLSGLGVGQTFGFMARPYIRQKMLAPVLEDWHRDKHPLYIVYPPNRHLSAKLRVFVDWAAEVFAKWSST